MSLSFPSRIGPNGQSSLVAEQNFNKLLRVDPRGNKNQVATTVALEYFNRSQSLEPGYFDGLKSWVKSNCIYALAGTLTLATIGGIAYGVAQSGYQAEFLMGAAATVLLSFGFETNPLKAAAGFLFLAVRDSAQRAASASMKGDVRAMDAKEKEALKCHEEILKQLHTVYNDCAQYLYDWHQQAGRLAKGDERIALKQMSDKLEEKMPTIANLLSQLNLSQAEIEDVLQTMKTGIRFVQTESCKLLTEPGSEKLNAEMIAAWPKLKISEIAIPFALKERKAAAESAKFGILDECKGYGSALFGGAAAMISSAAIVALIAATLHAYQNGGPQATIGRVHDLVSCNYPGQAVFNEFSGWTGVGAGLAIALPTAATIAKKGLEHSRASQANADYVEEEKITCYDNLRMIYDGVGQHLRRAPALTPAIRERLPAIRSQLQNSGFPSSEILSGLEQVVR